MWQDICVANQPMILEALQTFRHTLAELERAVVAKDGAAIANAFIAAGKVKQTSTHKFGEEIAELAVSIPDAPGALGQLAQALGCAGINIVGIEILHSREGLPGSVVLSFQDKDTADAASTVINSLHIPVQAR